LFDAYAKHLMPLPRSNAPTPCENPDKFEIGTYQ